MAPIVRCERVEVKCSGNADRGTEHGKIFEMALWIARIDRVGGGLGDNRSERIRHLDLRRSFISQKRVPIATQKCLRGAWGAQEGTLHPARGRADIPGDHDVDDIVAAREPVNWIAARRLNSLESDAGDCSSDLAGRGRRDVQQ
ncbi:MAG: hypothetical protein ACTH4Y_02495 [Microbacterium gubbeenense]|uniref:hypothetical protein n=1 Tax=Microbacterium gubbeenense TaxID=159896 RepID=UPI0012F9A594|nr:hypothetical protein [Microbacterium gubbeenense]